MSRSVILVVAFFLATRLPSAHAVESPLSNLSTAFDQAMGYVGESKKTSQEGQKPPIVAGGMGAPTYSLAQWQACDVNGLSLFNRYVRKTTRVELFSDPSGGAWTFISHDWKIHRFPERGSSGTNVFLCALGLWIEVARTPAAGLKVSVKDADLIIESPGHSISHIRASDIAAAKAKRSQPDETVSERAIAWMRYEKIWSTLIWLRIDPAAPIGIDVIDAIYRNIENQPDLASSWIRDSEMRKAAGVWIVQNMKKTGDAYSILLRLTPLGEYENSTIQMPPDLSLDQLKALAGAAATQH